MYIMYIIPLYPYLYTMASVTEQRDRPSLKITFNDIIFMNATKVGCPSSSFVVLTPLVFSVDNIFFPIRLLRRPCLGTLRGPLLAAEAKPLLEILKIFTPRFYSFILSYFCTTFLSHFFMQIFHLYFF